MAAQEEVVTISYNDLVSFSAESSSSSLSDVDSLTLVDKIGKAFGDGNDCLGILAVTKVPNLDPLRQKLLPLARELAILSPSELDQVTVESADYQVGWSHGKEKVEGDKFDTAKGSYYANPLTDDLLEATKTRDGVKDSTHIDQVAKENPAVFAPNVWPQESLPQLEQAFKELGKLVVEVGRLVARPCDAYVSDKCEGYPQGKIESVITDSMYCKGRLLHYFAPDTSGDKENDTGSKDTDFSDWCGWHNDHGSLTGLVPAMFLDEHGNEVVCPDKEAGLYIKSRSGRLVHVQLPPGSLGFQIGETSQIHSGGVLQATPHAVRGAGTNKITRESFAVFMEPEYFGDMAIPKGKTVKDTQRREAEEHLPKTVRTLRSRWKPGMNFGEFSNATFAAFY